jgi:hypothetical protein
LRGDIEPDQCASTEIWGNIETVQTRQNKRNWLQSATENRFEHPPRQEISHHQQVLMVASNRATALNLVIKVPLVLEHHANSSTGVSLIRFTGSDARRRFEPVDGLDRSAGGEQISTPVCQRSCYRRTS